jgi:hypothetical protein
VVLGSVERNVEDEESYLALNVDACISFVIQSNILKIVHCFALNVNWVVSKSNKAFVQPGKEYPSYSLISHDMRVPSAIPNAQ